MATKHHILYKVIVMDYKSYISSISFSLINPSDTGIYLISDPSVPSIVDIKNTILPTDDEKMKSILSEICKIPRMSTFAIGAIINLIVSEMPEDQTFVNIGVWHGFTFLCGLVNNPNKKCIGVDNFSEFDSPRDQFNERFNKYKSENHSFYDMDYIEYFSKVHKESIGFYIYDGNHSEEDQYNGLKIAEPFFSKDCLILIDDINWPNAINGTKEFLNQTKHKYNLIIEQRTSNNCHPTFWNGVAMFQKAE